MKTRWFRFPLLAAAALALGVGACEQTEQPLAVAPAASFNKHAFSESSGERLVLGRDGEGKSASAVIGRSGGELVLDQHKLLVPRGAVSSNTRFTMELVDPEYMIVELTAARVSDAAPVRTFDQTLTLQMSFHRLTENVDPASLVIFYQRPDGTLEYVPSDVNPKGKAVRAYLSHFSRYAVGSGRAAAPVF